MDELCRRAVELKRARQFAEAARVLREVVAVDPEHVEAFWVLGWALIELKDDAGAKQAFTRVIELEPNSDRATESQRAIERLGG